jgi:diguanylate cyclase (GGDEF)-like protein
MYQIKHPSEHVVDTQKSFFVPSESCGCKPSDEAIKARLRKIQNLQFESLQDAMMEIYFQRLQIALSDAEQKEDFYEKGLSQMRDLRMLGPNYCICTEPAFFEIEDEYYPGRIRGYSPKMDVLVEAKNGEKLPLSSFSSKKLYPGYRHKKGESNLYIFAPLNHLDYIIGYIAIKNTPTLLFNQGLRSWCMSMNALLFGMRRHIFAQKNNRELKRIYMTDALTGLYNRTGCQKVLYEFITAQKAKGERSILVFADIDRMKTINDVYGHLNGDLAIKATADAFHKFCPGDWLFSRYGGDEFIAVGSCLNPKAVPMEIKAISKSMTEYFDSLNLSFMLHASIGYTIIEPNDEGQIEDYIKQADDSMYKEKEKIRKLMDSMAIGKRL